MLGSKLVNEKSYGQKYISYLIKNRLSITIEDHHIFPTNKLDKHSDAYFFKKSPNHRQFKTIDFLDKGTPTTADFHSFMDTTGTTALILIKDDQICYEGYFNGYKRNNLHTLFSISKSFTSALVGIAIEKGYIGTVEDPISKYLPELKGINFTIKQLLQMDAGIVFNEGRFPWKDEAKTYLHPDGRKIALSVKADKNNGYFHYNDYHLLLLGLVLERATGVTNTEFFKNYLWNHLQPEFPGYVILDSKDKAFEKLESGFVMTAIDLAKFGRLFLHNGNWNGNQIINADWVQESVSRANVPSNKDHFKYYESHPWGKLWFRQNKAYYKYLWWGYKESEEYDDYFALGTMGQVLYISPKNNAIAIRLGKKWGVMDWWPSILNRLINQL